MVIVDDEAIRFKKEGRPHWSHNSQGNIVTSSHRGLRKEWVDERHTLPLERPFYGEQFEKLLDCDYGDPSLTNQGDEPAEVVLPVDEFF